MAELPRVGNGEGKRRRRMRIRRGRRVGRVAQSV